MKQIGGLFRGNKSLAKINSFVHIKIMKNTHIKNIFTCVKPNPHAKLRIFCFPYAGGAANVFHSWTKHLPEEVEVLTLNLPGRGTRLLEEPYKRMSSLIKATTEAIIPFLDKPFVFWGHSMGALVGFELARNLANTIGKTPECLFVSSCRSPRLPITDSSIHHLPHNQFIEELRIRNGTPKEVLENEELMELFTPTLRADFEICETYTYEDYSLLRCPILVFGGLSDKSVTEEQLLMWSQETSAHTRYQLFDGDHFYLNTASSELLRVISMELKPFIY